MARRVQAVVNGDWQSGGKVLSIAQKASFDEVFAQASSKLSTPGEAPLVFQAAYLPSGAQLGEVGDILDGDKIFFAGAEAFIQEGGGETKLAEDGQGKRQFLQSIATAAVAQGLRLYDSSYSFVQARSPQFAQGPLERANNTVAAVAGAVAGPVVGYGSPLIAWADGKLDNVYTRMESRTSQFIQSPVAQLLNENVVLPVAKSSEAFYSYAVATFQSLLEKSHDGRVNLAEFLDKLRGRLGGAWNERLVQPAKQFFALAQKELEDLKQPQAEGQGVVGSVFANLQTKLGAAWENTVLANYIPQPAEAFYRSALEAYVALAATAHDGKVSWQEFAGGLRVKLVSLWSSKIVGGAKQLGSLWNERLVGAARYLFEAFSQAGIGAGGDGGQPDEQAAQQQPTGEKADGGAE